MQYKQIQRSEKYTIWQVMKGQRGAGPKCFYCKHRIMQGQAFLEFNARPRLALHIGCIREMVDLLKAVDPLLALID